MDNFLPIRKGIFLKKDMKMNRILTIYFVVMMVSASSAQHHLYIGSGLNANFGYYENTDIVSSHPALGLQIEANYEFQIKKLFFGMATQAELINWKDQPDAFFRQTELKNRNLFLNLLPHVNYEVVKNLSVGAGCFYKRILGKQRFIPMANDWLKRNEYFSPVYDIGYSFSLIYRVSKFKFGFSYFYGFNNITSRFYDLEGTGAIIDPSLKSLHRVLQFRFLYKI